MGQPAKSDWSALPDTKRWVLVVNPKEPVKPKQVEPKPVDPKRKGVEIYYYTSRFFAPCAELQGVLASLNKVSRIYRINKEESPDWFNSAGVTQYPFFIIYLDGEERKRLTGRDATSYLKQLLKNLGGKPTAVGRPSLQGGWWTPAPRTTTPQTRVASPRYFVQPSFPLYNQSRAYPQRPCTGVG